jgi:hypothetical protein
MEASINTIWEELRADISTIRSSQTEFLITITKQVEGFLLFVVD